MDSSFLEFQTQLIQSGARKSVVKNTKSLVKKGAKNVLIKIRISPFNFLL
jgi:hypothetical protein